jgi:parallel beta-helix repeat protein
LSINNATVNNYNPDLCIEHLCISGNNAGTNQKGIYVQRTPVNFKEIYIVDCGGSGMHLQYAYASVLSNCIVANNYQHGIWLDKAANQVLISHCIVNANARIAGYSGIHCAGTNLNENIGVVIQSCDTTSNGGTVASGYGVVVQYTHGLVVSGLYSEGNKTNGIYIDSSAKNVTVEASYIQDEATSITGVEGLRYSNNRHFYNTVATSVAIAGAAGYPIAIEGNTYSASVTTSFTVGAKQRIEQYDTAAPVSGTWSVGDIVWHRTPVVGRNAGWICVTAGTPGTWASFGQIALDGSATYNPGNLADGDGTTTTVTVTGAALGDYASASFSLDLQGITLTAWVSATDTVSVRFQNESNGALDLASGTLRAKVMKV